MRYRAISIAVMLGGIPACGGAFDEPASVAQQGVSVAAEPQFPIAGCRGDWQAVDSFRGILGSYQRSAPYPVNELVSVNFLTESLNGANVTGIYSRVVRNPTLFGADNGSYAALASVPAPLPSIQFQPLGSSDLDIYLVLGIQRSVNRIQAMCLLHGAEGSAPFVLSRLF